MRDDTFRSLPRKIGPTPIHVVRSRRMSTLQVVGTVRAVVEGRQRPVPLEKGFCSDHSTQANYSPLSSLPDDRQATPSANPEPTVQARRRATYTPVERPLRLDIDPVQPPRPKKVRPTSPSTSAKFPKGVAVRLWPLEARTNGEEIPLPPAVGSLPPRNAAPRRSKLATVAA